MINILVVEDDLKFNQIICTCLIQHNYYAQGCHNPTEAYHMLFKKPYDLIISDIMMPGEDGFSFVKTIREKDQTIPILFITALDDFISREMGFHIGIDDYMVKPVDLEEMVLRVGALLRRANITNEKKLVIGSLTLVKDEMTAYVHDQEVHLLPREFNVLYKLLSTPKKVFTRSELVDEYWGLDGDTGLRTVDVYITKLRRKFAKCEDFEIVTIHGFGYKAVVK